jgi:hypothetical protein
MAVRTEIEQLYLRYIKPLSPEVRLRLLAVIASDLAADNDDEPRERSILELRGLGAEIWHGVDAQQYVNELRDEWEREV